MKKSLLLFGFMATLGLASLASCSYTNSNKKGDYLSKEDSLSLQAVTSMSMIDTTQYKINKFNNFNSTYTKFNLLKSKNNNNELTESEINDIKNILPTLDLMISNDSSFDSKIMSGSFKPIENDETKVFNTKEVITFLTSEGTKNSYTLFYDAAIKNVERDQNVKKEKSDIDDEKEIKTEEKIEGLAFLDESTYFPFVSSVETEIEDDEKEEEREFKIQTATNSYIEVKQEHEIEGNEVETEFEYKIVENGIVTLNYSVEIENEDNQVELGYEINDIEYELTKVNENGEILYKVEYENEKTDKEALIVFKKEVDENGKVKYDIVK